MMVAGEHDTARDPNPDLAATASDAAAIAADRPREPDRTGYVTGSGHHRLWYGVWHPATQPDRGAVVLSHGVSEYLGRYGRIIAALNEHGYTSVGLDHRGHGRSAGRRFTIRRFDDFVRDLGIAVNLAREVSAQRGKPARAPFLFGHSMGGLIATRYVLALPDQVALAGLILSSPALQVYPDLPRGALRVVGALAAVLPGLPARRGGSGILSGDPEVDRRWDADPLLNHGPTPLQMAHQIAASAREVRPRLAGITLPTLLLFGDADRLVDPAGARRLAKVAHNDDLTVREYPGLRHETFNEPGGDAVIMDMVDWIDAHTDRAPRRAGRRDGTGAGMTRPPTPPPPGRRATAGNHASTGARPSDATGAGSLAGDRRAGAANPVPPARPTGAQASDRGNPPQPSRGARQSLGTGRGRRGAAGTRRRSSGGVPRMRARGRSGGDGGWLARLRHPVGHVVNRRTETIIVVAALLLVAVLVLVVATRWWTTEQPHGTPMRVTDALVAAPRGDPDTAFSYAKHHSATRQGDVRAYLDEVYRLAPQVGLDPAIIVAQSALETANWTSDYWTNNLNPAGLNITYAGQESETWQNGTDAARAQIVHLAVYAFGPIGDDSPLAPYREIDPFYSATAQADFAGTVHTITDLADIWAADPNYATSLVGRGDDVFGGGVSSMPSDSGALPAVGHAGRTGRGGAHSG